MYDEDNSKYVDISEMERVMKVAQYKSETFDINIRY